MIRDLCCRILCNFFFLFWTRQLPVWVRSRLVGCVVTSLQAVAPRISLRSETELDVKDPEKKRNN